MTFSIIINQSNELKLDWITKDFNEETGFSFECLLDTGKRKKYIHPNDHKIAEKTFEEVLNGNSSMIELRLITGNGKIIWYHFAFHPALDESQNEKMRIYGAGTNISQQKNTEEEFHKINNELNLRLLEKKVQIETNIKNLQDEIEIKISTNAKLKEYEDAFKRLVENSPTAIAIHQNGKIIHTNSKAVDLLGANSFENVLDNRMISFVHPDHRGTVLSIMEEEASNLKVLPAKEIKYIRFDGKAINVDVILVPFLLNGVMTYANFISESKTKFADHNLSSNAVNNTQKYFSNKEINERIHSITNGASVIKSDRSLNSEKPIKDFS
jgi:PAS domain S-box-containing protein